MGGLFFLWGNLATHTVFQLEKTFKIEKELDRVWGAFTSGKLGKRNVFNKNQTFKNELHPWRQKTLNSFLPGLLFRTRFTEHAHTHTLTHSALTHTDTKIASTKRETTIRETIQETSIRETTIREIRIRETTHTHTHVHTRIHTHAKFRQ